MSLFLYGTLRHRPLLELVAGDLGGAVARAARLPGHRVMRQAEAPWPALVEGDGEAEGVLWTGLPAAALDRLDGFEVPFGYVRAPVTVAAEGGAAAAEAYRPPEGLDVSDRPWSVEGWLAEDRGATLAIAEEIAAHDPPLLGEPLRRAWGMLAHRAWARLRALDAAPTALRHRAGPGDWRLDRREPVVGSFFAFERLAASHRRFDGGRNEGLPREAIVGADAALVLPFDRARDRVLLVEQFRTGPARRGDPEPWTLEPVAGLVDAGETPEEAARREAEEEAGLDVRDLTRMFAGYASPGNATDHFYAFLALCDLPDGFATSGGLAEEHEDLRLHVLPFADAFALIETGEANAMPLISMLLWLDRWRARRVGAGASSP